MLEPMVKNTQKKEDTLKEWVQSMGNLPSNSLILLLGLEVVEDPGSGASDLARLVYLDPALALKVYRQASSAAYGGKPPENITQAIMRTGFESVKEVITLFLKVAKFASFSPTEKSIFDDLWTHSVLSGIAAYHILKKSNIRSKEMLEKARMIGLFHDAGRFGLLTCDPERHEKVVQGPLQGHLGSPHRERMVFGFTHEELGGAMARKWNMGIEMEWVLSSHHFPIRAPREFKSVHLAHLADWAALKIQDEWFPGLRDPERSSLRILGIKPQDLRISIAGTKKEWEETKEYLRESSPLKQG